MQQAYIINGIRTAIGNLGGALSTVRTDDLATLVLKKLIIKMRIMEDAIVFRANHHC